MKAIMLMFDSLNKHMLSAYGCDDTITPNFKRLQEKTTRFDNFYVGSMPCMPARRELHTGRYNFMHRSWSPLEPFDDSMPEILKKNGIYSHLVTDHKHYWRDGGATYHSRFNSYEFVRGQEGDNWKGVVKKPDIKYESGEPEEIKKRKITSRTHHQINVNYMKDEKDHHLYKTIELGLDFIETNKDDDNWFLQLECFDPHEPFFVPEKYLKMYGIEKDDFDGFPSYYFVTESEVQQEKIKSYYKALLTMVDDHVGKVLDYMDRYDLWDDTLLIVNTDHGFLLGEHDWWSKNIMPLYNEIANTPFFIWHPDHPRAGVSRQALAQTIDIVPTILEFFGQEIPEDMEGKSLVPAIANDEKIRDYALFGYHGCHVNITDGQYVYMRAPTVTGAEHLYEYTLMPTRINQRFTPQELENTTLHHGFKFTKGCPLLKIPATFIIGVNAERFGHRLYDIKSDSCQNTLLEDEQNSLRMMKAMNDMMIANDAPEEAFIRYGFNEPLTIEKVKEELSKNHVTSTTLDYLDLDISIKYGALYLIQFLKEISDNDTTVKLVDELEHIIDTPESLHSFVLDNIDEKHHPMVFYRMALEMRVN